MNNELIKINDNQLELTQEGIKFIKKMQKAKVELNKMEEELKDLFKDNMEKYNISKYISPDGLFSATYVAETTSNRFDTTNFKKDHEDLYNEYLKTTTRKSYVKFN